MPKRSNGAASSPANPPAKRRYPTRAQGQIAPEPSAKAIPEPAVASKKSGSTRNDVKRTLNPRTVLIEDNAQLDLQDDHDSNDEESSGGGGESEEIASSSRENSREAENVKENAIGGGAEAVHQDDTEDSQIKPQLFGEEDTWDSVLEACPAIKVGGTKPVEVSEKLKPRTEHMQQLVGETKSASEMLQNLQEANTDVLELHERWLYKIRRMEKMSDEIDGLGEPEKINRKGRERIIRDFHLRTIEHLVALLYSTILSQPHWPSAPEIDQWLEDFIRLQDLVINLWDTIQSWIKDSKKPIRVQGKLPISRKLKSMRKAFQNEQKKHREEKAFLRKRKEDEDARLRTRRRRAKRERQEREMIEKDIEERRRKGWEDVQRNKGLLPTFRNVPQADTTDASLWTREKKLELLGQLEKHQVLSRTLPQAISF